MEGLELSVAIVETGNGQIFGAYIPENWSKLPISEEKSLKIAADSFIFSFDNQGKIRVRQTKIEPELVMALINKLNT